MKYNRIKAFTVAEMMIVVFIFGVIIASSLPVMTVRNQSGGFEDNSIKCIVGESGEDTSTNACLQSKKYCIFNQNQSCSTLTYYADNGKTNEKSKSRKLLSEICNEGGIAACKYFVDSCKKDYSTCDIAGSNYDLNYYLTLSPDSSQINSEMNSYINSYYLSKVPNIENVVNNTCLNNLNTNSCSLVIANSLNGDKVFENDLAGTCSTNPAYCNNIITKCNEGETTACKIGYTTNLNRNCKQIKDKLPSAVDGTYNITQNGYQSDKILSTTCDMTRDAGGWTLVWHGYPTHARFNDISLEKFSITGVIFNKMKVEGVNINSSKIDNTSETAVLKETIPQYFNEVSMQPSGISPRVRFHDLEGNQDVTLTGNSFFYGYGNSWRYFWVCVNVSSQNYIYLASNCPVIRNFDFASVGCSGQFGSYHYCDQAITGTALDSFTNMTLRQWQESKVWVK